MATGRGDSRAAEPALAPRAAEPAPCPRAAEPARYPRRRASCLAQPRQRPMSPPSPR